MHSSKTSPSHVKTPLRLIHSASEQNPLRMTDSITMSQPPPLNPSSVQTNAQTYGRAVHNAALGAVIIAPVLALLPPRKLDLYTLGLVGTAAYSGNYLLKESSGRSVWEHLGPRSSNSSVLSSTAAVAVPSPPGGDGNGSGSMIGNIQQELRGSARETWKAQRRREIQEEVEEGKGFGDMIMDQIWEVWNGGKTSVGQDDEESKGKREN